jgi:NHLM bacteriocin system ABC transporter peptidase/ATP-binding protein
MGNYVKTPTVYQMETTECGAASLAMIMGYFGRHMPLEQARVEVDVSRDGVNAANIMRAAKRFGLDCHGYRKKAAELREIETPCIIFWNHIHYVVFEGFKGDYAYINDPAIGRRRLSPDELDECYSDIVLTFSKTDSFQPMKKQSGVPAFLKERIKSYKHDITKLFCAGMILVLPGLVLPALSKIFIDNIFISGRYEMLLKIAAFMCCCVFITLGMTLYRELLLQKLKERMNLTSCSELLLHMLRLPIDFFDRRSTGDLVSRMNNSSELNEFLLSDLADVVLNIFAAIVYAAALLLCNPLLALAGMAAPVISTAVLYSSNKVSDVSSFRMQMSMGKLYSSMCSGYGITDTIKATSAENEYITKVLGNQVKSINDRQDLGRFQNIISALPVFTGEISNIIILALGSVFVIKGRLTIGMLAAFVLLFASFCAPMEKLAGCAGKLKIFIADINRVGDIAGFDEDKCYFNGEASDKYKFNGKLELRNVSFGYSKFKAPLIKDLSFKLEPGESIAFVGMSGCGKSTVSKIVSGLYHPWGGEVLLDDIPIDDISKTVFNSAVATVSQNISLFSGTVRDNLTMWRNDILDELLDEATKDACIYDEIMAMGGYDALLGENAQNLSGGQRQRLEIARALVTSPAVLVLDEATSALDAKTEQRVLENIRRRGCTCVVVAHRLSAIRDCRCILVLENGKVVESGDHESLIKQDGIYKTLVSNI